MGCHVSSHAHISNWGTKPGCNLVKFESDSVCWRCTVVAGCGCSGTLSTSGGADNSSTQESGQQLSLWWFPSQQVSDRTPAGLPTGGSVAALRLVCFPKSTLLTQKSPRQQISTTVCKRRTWCCQLCKHPAFPSRRLRWRKRKTIPHWAAATEAKALHLEAENKFAALSASSWPSERRLLFTPVLRTMLLEDNTFKDIKMCPAAYLLSPYWLDQQSRAKTHTRFLWDSTWAWATGRREQGTRSGFKDMG